MQIKWNVSNTYIKWKILVILLTNKQCLSEVIPDLLWTAHFICSSDHETQLQYWLHIRNGINPVGYEGNAHKRRLTDFPVFINVKKKRQFRS